MFRSKARVLQAYNDGKYLHIRKSKFCHFTENNKENYKLFVRWIHSIPCGDTFAPLSIQPIKSDDWIIKKVDKKTWIYFLELTDYCALFFFSLGGSSVPIPSAVISVFYMMRYAFKECWGFELVDIALLELLGS